MMDVKQCQRPFVLHVISFFSFSPSFTKFYWFVYIEPSLFPWNETNLTLVYGIKAAWLSQLHSSSHRGTAVSWLTSGSVICSLLLGLQISSTLHNSILILREQESWPSFDCVPQCWSRHNLTNIFSWLFILESSDVSFWRMWVFNSYFTKQV